MTVMLSGEQMHAVHAGGNKMSWGLIDLPVGPQPVPEWCKGVHVNWMDDYANWPDVRFKTNCEARDWPDKVYRKEGSCYRAYHEDGRLEQYAHDGPVSLEKIRMFRGEDGVLRQRPRYGAQWYVERPNVKVYPASGYEEGEWEEVEMLCTTKQAGFGGENYHLKMENGTTIVVRGPWHTSSPRGYTEVAFVNVSDRSLWHPRRNVPWHRRTGRAGLIVRDDVFVNIMARYVPHLPLALVDYGFMSHVEPFLEEWGEPKRVKLDREWEQRAAAKKSQEARNART